jgi:regulator of sigma D
MVKMIYILIGWKIFRIELKNICSNIMEYLKKKYFELYEKNKIK